MVNTPDEQVAPCEVVTANGVLMYKWMQNL